MPPSVGYRPTFRDRLLDAILSHPNRVYFGTLALVFSLLLTGLVVFNYALGSVMVLNQYMDVGFTLTIVCPQTFNIYSTLS